MAAPHSPGSSTGGSPPWAGHKEEPPAHAQTTSDDGAKALQSPSPPEAALCCPMDHDHSLAPHHVSSMRCKLDAAAILPLTWHGPGKAQGGLGALQGPSGQPQQQRCSESLQAPRGWVSTSHPRWAGFLPVPGGLLQQHPARLSSEKGISASPCPRRRLGLVCHGSWMVMVGKGQALP